VKLTEVRQNYFFSGHSVHIYSRSNTSVTKIVKSCQVVLRKCIVYNLGLESAQGHAGGDLTSLSRSPHHIGTAELGDERGEKLREEMEEYIKESFKLGRETAKR